MDSLLHKYDSSILAALVKADHAAWCFLPVSEQEDILCSRLFLLLWSMAPGSGDQNACFRKRDQVAQVLAQQGIDPEEFFSRVVNRDVDDLSPVLLVRRDLHKLQAEITTVTTDSQVTGHLIRFHERVDSGLVESLLQQISDAQQRLEILSARESEILHLIYEGRTNKAIAITTGISEKTVEKHRSRVMHKLGLTCPAELFRLVSKAWLLSDVLKYPVLVSENPPAPYFAKTLHPPLAAGEK